MKINQQARIRERIAIDEAEAEQRERIGQDASSIHPPAMRSERETNRLMAILDSLEPSTREEAQ